MKISPPLLSALFLLSACAGPEVKHPLLNPSLARLRRIPLPPARIKVIELVERRLARGDADHVSVMFQCLSTGYWFGINEHENFVPASLLKNYMAIMVLKAAESDPELLRRKLKYQDYSGLFAPGYHPRQRVKPEHTLTFGQSYTIDRILRQMISQSDNDAAYNLQNAFPIEAFQKILDDYGLRIPEEGEAYLSLKNYMMMLLSLYNASYLNIEMSQRLLAMLEAGAFDQGLAAGLPPGTRLANKFGEREFQDGGPGSAQLHDCGIVYHPNAPYLLGVMTRGTDIKRQTALIKDISALVYSEVDSGVKLGR